MSEKDILKIVNKIVDKCYGYAWFDYKMADSNTPAESRAKTLMKMFDYIGRALKEEEQ